MVQMSRWKVTLLALALVFGLVFSYANLLSPAQRAALPGWAPKSTLNLGLDLQQQIAHHADQDDRGELDQHGHQAAVSRGHR